MIQIDINKILKEIDRFYYPYPKNEKIDEYYESLPKELKTIKKMKVLSFNKIKKREFLKTLFFIVKMT